MEEGESIQAAVDAADNRDTIIVSDGTYTENVDVNTPHLTIQSENGSKNCIVQASNSDDDVFGVRRNSVSISGFTVKGATGVVHAGIYLSSAFYCNIKNNNISNNYYGIRLYRSSTNNNIINNTVSNNDLGILLDDYSSSNTITNNTASNNNYGIDLSHLSGNRLSNNTISNNNYGIFSYASSINIVTNNTISNNNKGIYLSDVGNNVIRNNIVSNNTQYGLYFYKSNNRIYLSNFINNSNNIYSYKSSNIWNSIFKNKYGYKGETYTNYAGNYWKDYNGIDDNNDRIGDTPYSINLDKDNYPLMERVENYFVITEPIIMKLKVEPGGKDKLRVNFTTTLDDEFRVDLKVRDYRGIEFHSNPANHSQCFHNITSSNAQEHVDRRKK